MTYRLLLYVIYLLTSVLSPITLQAQQISGLDLSNYGGLYRATYNPSTLGGTPYKFQVNALTMGGSIGRRYFDFFGKNSFLTPIIASHSSNEIYGRSRTMKSLIDNRIHLQSEIRWPSILFSVGKIHGFAIQARTRGYIYGEVPDAVKTLYTQRMDTDVVAENNSLIPLYLSVQQQSFSDLSFSYGISVINSKSHKLKLGVTGKRVTGARLSSIDMTADQLSINQTSSTSKEMVFDNVDYTTYYTSELKEQKLPALLNQSEYGSGWGYDLGFTYELGNVWKNKKEAFDDSPTYFLRLSGSVTDIGSINYNPNNAKLARGNLTRLSIGQDEMQKIANEGAKGFMNLIAQNGVDSLERKIVSLPSVIHLEADVQLTKSFFVNVSTSSGLVSTKPDAFKGNLHNLTYTRITPRFEGQDFDLVFPVTFFDGQKPQFGVTAHFGPLFVSFSNVTGIFKPKEQKGAAMAYIGLSVFKLKK